MLRNPRISLNKLGWYGTFDSCGGYPSAIDLSKLSNTTGFAIYGAKAEDYLGRSVSLAGDFNHDGIDDILIGTVNGSPKGRNGAGLAYIIYGVKGGYSSAIDLLHLPSTTGFAIYGARAGDGFGRSVNFAGDFNNDGISDVVIGAQFASYRNRANAGSSYVIYGTKGGYSSAIDLLHLSSAMGFRIDGATANDWIGGVGRTVSFAGDFNKDGIDDIIIGGYNAAPSKRSGAGLAYVIYGSKSGYPAGIDLANFSSSMGFQIDGAVEGGALGASVSQAGDINHDGIDDIIIGAPWASHNGKSQVGSSYVIYGVRAGYPSKIDLTKLCGSMGFRMDGGGYSVRSAKDVNSDGINDVIIGAPDADRSYVVYGKQGGYNTVINLDNLRSTDGFEIVGASEDSACGSSVSQAGDINHDGIEDVIVGAMRASTNGKNQVGSSYVIYGTNLTAVSISTTNSNTEKRSNSKVGKLDATVSPASSVRPSWFSFEGWHTIFNALWSQPKLEKLTPRAEELTKLQAKCVLMIAQANSKTADKWYQYSLEDLQEEMAAILKQPEMITEKTIKRFSRMLEGIDKDFLRAPLLEKPSFFAGIKNRIEAASCSPSNEGTLLHPSTQLMLGAGYVAPTSSCFLDI